MASTSTRNAGKEGGTEVTLIRGRSYSLVHPFDRTKGIFKFERGKPLIVRDPAVVDFLRDKHEEVIDGDGSATMKPIFSIGGVAAAEPALSARPRRGRPARKTL